MFLSEVVDIHILWRYVTDTSQHSTQHVVRTRGLDLDKISLSAKNLKLQAFCNFRFFAEKRVIGAAFTKIIQTKRSTDLCSYNQYPTFYDTLKIHEQLRVKVTNLTAGRFSERRMVDRDKFCFLNKGSVKVSVGRTSSIGPGPYVISGSIRRTLRPPEQTLHDDKFTNF